MLPAGKLYQRRSDAMDDTYENLSAAAIELKDGTIVTGKNSCLMDAASSLILNAIKTVAGIPDNIHLLSPNVIESIQRLRGYTWGKDQGSEPGRNPHCPWDQCHHQSHSPGGPGLPEESGRL